MLGGSSLFGDPLKFCLGEVNGHHGALDAEPETAVEDALGFDWDLWSLLRFRTQHWEVKRLRSVKGQA